MGWLGWSVWMAVAVCGYTYVLYPVLLWIFAGLFGAPPTCRRIDEELPGMEGCWPRVCVLIAAHNEEDVIACKLRNTLELDYPPECLEVLVGSDGSGDRTELVVTEFAQRDPRIRLMSLSPQRGKAALINAAMERMDAPVVVLTDANTYFERAAIRRLVTGLRLDERTGAVVGEIRLVSPAGFRAEGSYWRYEVLLKRLEDRLGAVLGANGGCYAIRRSDFIPLPGGVVTDDFVLPLLIALRRGLRIRYDSRVSAREETAAGVESEFERKSRIGAGNYQSLQYLWPLLNPWRGWLAFAFGSHKVMRWLAPFCLIFLLPASAVLAVGDGLFRALFGIQVLVYGLGWLGGRGWTRGWKHDITAWPRYFLAMNLALANGFGRWIVGGQRATWRGTPRWWHPEAEPGGKRRRWGGK